MAWLELHQSIRDNRKILQAADILDITPAYMIGCMCLLWLWALDNAEDGILTGISNNVLAKAAQFDGDVDKFVATLSQVKLLDVDNFENNIDNNVANDVAQVDNNIAYENNFCNIAIHDWSNYGGKLAEQKKIKRAKEAARYEEKQNFSRQKNSINSDGRTTAESKRTDGRNPAIHNITLHNITKEGESKSISKINQSLKTDKEIADCPSGDFEKPSLEAVTQYIEAKGYSVNPREFVAYYDDNGWMVGRGEMKSWRAVVSAWERRAKGGRAEPRRNTAGDTGQAGRVKSEFEL